MIKLSSSQKDLLRLYLDNCDRQKNGYITVNEMTKLLQVEEKSARSKLSSQKIKEFLVYHNKVEVGKDGTTYLDLKSDVTFDKIEESLNEQEVKSN